MNKLLEWLTSLITTETTVIVYTLKEENKWNIYITVHFIAQKNSIQL